MRYALCNIVAPQSQRTFFIKKTRGNQTMTFYQELQLSSVGSKQLIKNTTDKKEKRRHIPDL